MSNNYDPNDPNNPNQGYPPTGTPQNYSAPNPGYNQPPPQGYGAPPPPGYQPPSGYGQQPQGGGYQQPGPDFNKMGNEAQATVGSLTRKWSQAINARTPDYFAREAMNATWNGVIIGLIVLGLVSGLIGAVLALITGAAYGGIGGAAVAGVVGLIVGPIVGIIAAAIGFFIGVGLTYLFGKVVFGGQGGDFLQIAYAISLYYVPISLAQTAVGIVMTLIILAVPGLYFLSTIVSILFMLVLGYFLYLAVQGVFKLNSQNGMWVTFCVLGVPILLSILAVLGIGIAGTGFLSGGRF